MTRNRSLWTALFALLAVPSLQAGDFVGFSFASDDIHAGPTFQAQMGGDIIDQAIISGDVPEVDLMVDVNGDDPSGQVTFQVRFFFFADLRDYQVISMGSNWVHMWKGFARIDFFHSSGHLLTIASDDILVTSWSPNVNTLGETLTLQASRSIDPFTTFAPQGQLKGVGVTAESVADSHDFAFTFTHVRVTGTTNQLVGVDNSGQFKDSWVAEGSFSASGTEEEKD